MPVSNARARRCRSWAGQDYGEDSLVEYCLRRTRGWMIAGGTTEILLNRIAENVFDRRFPQGPS